MSFSIRASRHHTSSTPATKSRKVIIILLVLLSLFLIGTVIVLSSVSYYLRISLGAYLTEAEVPWLPQDTIKPLLYNPNETSQQHRRQEWEEIKPAGAAGVIGVEGLPEVWEELKEEIQAEEYGATAGGLNTPVAVSQAEEQVEWDVDGRGSGGYWMEKDWDGVVKGTDSWDRLFNVTTRPGEKIPRLIHQTWKSEHLPEKWRKAWKECREGMPDYEYMLWTDDLSHAFVKQFYPAHLQMFESYKYPIQRADSIRYFILHHFGGIYMDLDIGCRRRMDPLLQGEWEAILPLTKPVGVSNDLIFSAKGSAFMDDTVHGLAAWNHEWFTNYPTVMFSTGPMFLSAQYSIYTSAHPLTASHPRAEVRILPKSLYGKNVPADTVPHAFFSHFYGSSWHSDDAGFITFLGSWGKKLMYIGAVVLVFGAIRLIYLRWTGGPKQQYQLLSFLPTSNSSGSHSGTTTPTSSLGSGPFSPNFETHPLPLPPQIPGEIASAFRRAGNLILAAPATLIGDRRGRRRTGLLYFVPALFQPEPVTHRRQRTASEASQLPIPLGRVKRPPPPPYEPPPGVDGGGGMEEVDAFLKDADGDGLGVVEEPEGFTDEDGIDGEGEGEGEWAQWKEGSTH